MKKYIFLLFPVLLLIAIISASCDSNTSEEEPNSSGSFLNHTVNEETSQLTNQNSEENISEITETNVLPNENDNVNFFKSITMNVYKKTSIDDNDFDIFYDTCSYIKLSFDKYVVDKDKNIFENDSGKIFANFGEPFILNEKLSITSMLSKDYSMIGNNIYKNSDSIYYINFDGIYLPVYFTAIENKNIEFIKTLTAETYALTEMKQAEENDIVYEAYFIADEYSSIRIPMINDNSPEIKEFNTKIRDSFFHNYLTHYGNSDKNDKNIYKNYNFIKNIIGKYVAIDFNDERYCYNLREKREITYEEYIHFSISEQLMSDEFFDTYFKNFVDHNYVITPEKDGVGFQYNNIKMVLSGKYGMEIPIVSYRSNYWEDIYYISSDDKFNIEKYKTKSDTSDDSDTSDVSDTSEGIVKTGYSASFITEYVGSYDSGWPMHEWINDRFDIPQINSEKPSATEINKKIIGNCFNDFALEKFKICEIGKGDCLGNVFYISGYKHAVKDNIVTILQYSTYNLIGSESAVNYFFTYYDYANDIEMTCEEYLTALGYTYDEILIKINKYFDFESYASYYGIKGTEFTKENINGVFLREDGIFEICVNNEILLTLPSIDDGIKQITMEQYTVFEKSRSREEMLYSGVKIKTQLNENYFYDFPSEIPYKFYFEKSSYAVIGIFRQCINFAFENELTHVNIEITAQDIMDHHKADMSKNYTKLSAQINGTGNGIIFIEYQLDELSGKIFYNIEKNEMYFDGKSDIPFYKNNAADLISCENGIVKIFSPHKNIKISFEPEGEIISILYHYTKGIETFNIKTYLYKGRPIYHEYNLRIFVDSKNYDSSLTKNSHITEAAKNLLAVSGERIGQKSKIFGDNIFSCSIIGTYKNYSGQYEEFGGICLIYHDFDKNIDLILSSHRFYSHPGESFDSIVPTFKIE